MNQAFLRRICFLVFTHVLAVFAACGVTRPEKKVITGAAQTEVWLPLIRGKAIGVVANPTSVIGNTHLVDTLKSLNADIRVVFAPEHGFRGEAEAGETVKNGIDNKSGVRITSLYGDQKKPGANELKDLDVILFDIQDVGARFYTYISTLQYIMEACAEHKIKLVVMDRPNPHGFYVDGPVLDTAFSSFVGMQPIPVVHGMTMAEYACMLNGEKWLDKKVQCELVYIPMKDWDHLTYYNLPVKPSPNLPNMTAIHLYPSLCFFEGTMVSVGRGTDKPFQQIGYPGKPSGNIEFIPRSIPGVAASPLHEGKTCRGFDLTEFSNDILRTSGTIVINWLIQSYQEAPDTAKFFNNFFDKLAGNSLLREQIRAGTSEEEIRNSWAEGIYHFKKIRRKYLLYKDFE